MGTDAVPPAMIPGPVLGPGDGSNRQGTIPAHDTGFDVSIALDWAVNEAEANGSAPRLENGKVGRDSCLYIPSGSLVNSNMTAAAAATSNKGIIEF